MVTIVCFFSVKFLCKFVLNVPKLPNTSSKNRGERRYLCNVLDPVNL